MRLVPTAGTDRVADALRAALTPGVHLDLASPEFSLFAFAELRPFLDRLARCRVVLPLGEAHDLAVLGGDDDRAARNRLQDAVIDLEDLSSGVSIADLTLNDFRLDLARYEAARPGALERLPLGSCAVATAFGSGDWGVPPGTIFCSRVEGETARHAESGDPLAPHYLVHVGDGGAVLLPYMQAKQTFDRLRRPAAGRVRTLRAGHAGRGGHGRGAAPARGRRGRGAGAAQGARGGQFVHTRRLDATSAHGE